MSTNLFDASKEARRWRDDFVLRLRMTNVPGARVGDALKTVEEHCRETGQEPREAFGDPRDYADSLGLGRRTPLSTYLLVVPAFFGATFLAAGLPRAISGDRVPFTWVDFTTWALVIGGSLALVAAMGRVRRTALVFAVGYGVIFAGIVLLSVIGNGARPLMHASAWLMTAAGLLLLAYTIVVVVREIRSNKIADPVTGEDMLMSERGWAPLVVVLVPVLMLIAVVLLSLLTD